MLNMAAETGMIYNGWGGYEKVPQRYGHSGGNDGQGTGLQGILIAWERTGDAQYRDALKSSLKDELLRPKNEPWDLGMSDAFGMLQAIVDYTLLTGDTEARQICIENANKIKTIKRNWMWPGSFIGIVAGGYRLTGDPKLLSLLKSMVEEQTKKGVDNNCGFYISSAISAIKDAGRK
jgi:rhamnogalacturonyl hydrolase YesR